MVLHTTKCIISYKNPILQSKEHRETKAITRIKYEFSGNEARVKQRHSHLVPVIPVSARSREQDRPSSPHRIVGVTTTEESGSLRRQSDQVVVDFAAADGDRGGQREEDHGGGEADHGGSR